MREPQTFCTYCGETAPRDVRIVHPDFCKSPNADDVHVGPDCLNGKHTACRVEAWCQTDDQATPCECECHDEWIEPEKAT